MGGDSGPREAFDKYFSAAKRGDCEALYNMSIESVEGPPAAEYCEGQDIEGFDDDEFDISVDEVTEDGDNATVTVSVTYQDEYMDEPQTDTQDFLFERVDGKWLFSGYDF
jgi:hypothetical protein